MTKYVRKVKNYIKQSVVRFQIWLCNASKTYRPFLNRVSTKWLNLLRKICAIFAQILFLQTCSFAQFAQNCKFYAKCNFLGKLSKIDILSLELNN